MIQVGRLSRVRRLPREEAERQVCEAGLRAGVGERRHFVEWVGNGCGWRAKPKWRKAEPKGRRQGGRSYEYRV